MASASAIKYRAAEEAELRLEVEPRRGRYREPLRLVATLLGVDGRPIRGVRVEFEARGTRGWRVLGSAETDAQGRCERALRAARGREFRARRAANPERSGCASAPVYASVIPRLEVTVERRSLRRGRPVAVAGRLRPRKRHVRVELERSTGAGGWTRTAAVAVPTRGTRFRAELPIDTLGSHRVRVAFAGDAVNAPVASDWVQLWVSR